MRCDVLARSIDKMKKHTATLNVPKETGTQTSTVMRTFYETGNVGQHKIQLAGANHTQVGMQRGEWIVCNLGLRRRDSSKER